MDIASEQLIPAPQAEVWRGLNDPQVLKACIPGCETIERIDATHYRIALTARVGPVKAKFLGNLVLADLDPRQADPYRRMILEYGVRLQRMREKWLEELLARATEPSMEKRPVRAASAL